MDEIIRIYPEYDYIKMDIFETLQLVIFDNYPPFDPKTFKFTFTKNTLHETKKVCNEISTIFPKEVNDGIITMNEDEELIWGKAVDFENNFPVLSCLTDAFSRYCAYKNRKYWSEQRPTPWPRGFSRNNKDESVTLNAKDWFVKRSKIRGTFCNHIQNETDKGYINMIPGEFIKTSVAVMTGRMFPKFNYDHVMSPTIFDKYDSFAKIVCAMNKWVYAQSMKNNTAKMYREWNHFPMQIDLWIIPRLVKSGVYYQSVFGFDDDDDGSRIESLRTGTENTIWDLEENLKYKYKDNKSDDKKDDEYNDWRDGYIKGKDYFMSARDDQMNVDNANINDITKWINRLWDKYNDHRGKGKGWREMRYKRYILIIDRRNPEHIKKKKMMDDTHKDKTWSDRIYLIRPKKCGTISKRYAFVLNECFAANTKDYLFPIPGKEGYGNDFGGLMSGNGYKFLISYQLYFRNKVKMYWYLNQSVHRFFMNDINWLWPRYFKTRNDKNTFDSFQRLTDDTKIELDLISKEHKLEDKDFQQFLKTAHLYARNIYNDEEKADIYTEEINDIELPQTTNMLMSNGDDSDFDNVSTDTLNIYEGNINIADKIDFDEYSGNFGNRDMIETQEIVNDEFELHTTSDNMGDINQCITMKTETKEIVNIETIHQNSGSSIDGIDKQIQSPVVEHVNDKQNEQDEVDSSTENTITNKEPNDTEVVVINQVVFSDLDDSGNGQQSVEVRKVNNHNHSNSELLEISSTNSASTVNSTDNTTNGASTLSLPDSILSSDDTLHITDSNSVSAEDNASDGMVQDVELPTNIVQNASLSVSKLIKIINSWEISVDSSALQALQQKLKTTKDPNNIVSFSSGGQNDKTYKKLDGEKKHNDNNNEDRKNNENNSNGNHQDYNNIDRDGGGDDNDGKDGDDGDDGDEEDNDDNRIGYSCNVHWHSQRMKELEKTVREQNQEIMHLRLKLQKETEFRLLMQVDRIIGDYYRSQHVNNYYFDGNGRFLQFIINKNLNDGKLSKQLSDNYYPENCIYTDFDPEFPFPDFIDEDTMNDCEKQKIIFGIIQYCFQHKTPPSDEYIGRNMYQIQIPQKKLTVMDGMYGCIKQSDNISSSDVTSLKYTLAEEEYDSDALFMDIVTDDSDASNVAQLIQNNDEYALIQQYMYQNIIESSSAVECIIIPSRKLTNKIIPNCVEQEFRDNFGYMKKYIQVHGNHAIIKCNNGKNLVVDYNFHCKQESKETETELYVVCDRETRRNGSVWKTRNKLFKWEEIQTSLFQYLLEIPTPKPKPMQMKPLLMYAVEQNRKQILNLLQNKNQRYELIQRKSSPWTHRDKIPIFGKRSKRVNKSKSLSLHLTKEEWVKRVSTFANDNADNIILVPIVIFEGNKYYVDIVWIVQIGMGINVGISLKLHRNNKKSESLKALGIYLDIYDEHQLVPYEHNCHCLRNFVCNIDCLRIGDTEQNQMMQKNKELQKKLRTANKHINTLENTQKNAKIATKNRSCVSKINGQSNKNPNGYHLHCCQCLSFQRNIVLQTSLNDHKNIIKLLQELREKDINAIAHIKSVCMLLQYDLQRTEGWFQSLLHKQNELERQQNGQQQLINSLKARVPFSEYITKLENINNFYFQQTLNSEPSIIIPHQEHK